MSLTASKPDKAYGSHRHSPASVLNRMWRHPLTAQTPRSGDEPALDVLAANGVVHCPPGRPGGYRSYQLVPRIPGDLYALSARIAGGNDFATEDTRALACAIAAHTPCSLDADLAAAAAAALDEYEGYARSGEQRVWTLDDVQRHVETWHHMLTWHRRAFAPQAVEGGAA